MLFTKIVTFSSLLAFALAAPFIPEVAEKRDVVAPKMFSPTASTVWQAGKTYNVTWDTADLPPPANITNKIGQVILGQFESNGDEHLDFDTPLAKDFPITSGSVAVVAPDVPTGKYFLVLFGDSGNNGPTFTIENNSSSSSASASLSTSATPSSATAASSSASDIETTGSAPSTTFSGPLSDPSTLSDSPAPVSVSSTPLSTPSSASSASSASFASSGSLSLPASSSRSIVSPLPSASGNSSATTQQSSSSTLWGRTDSCLAFAAAALSAVLLLA